MFGQQHLFCFFAYCWCFWKHKKTWYCSVPKPCHDWGVCNHEIAWIQYSLVPKECSDFLVLYWYCTVLYSYQVQLFDSMQNVIVQYWYLVLVYKTITIAIDHNCDSFGYSTIPCVFVLSKAPAVSKKPKKDDADQTSKATRNK